MADERTNPPATVAAGPATARASYAAPAPVALARRSWVAVVVPFVPIVLALAGAFIARQYQQGTDMAMASGPMVGMKAPDFDLQDAHREDGDKPVNLTLLANQSRGVLVVFYMGYSCPRCLHHLGDIAGDIEEFKKAHVQVVAISPWTPANTRDSINIYGDFPFPLLSDPEGKISQAYGLVGADGMALHGMFLIDQDRRVVWLKRTEEPFTDIVEVLGEARKMGK